MYDRLTVNVVLTGKYENISTKTRPRQRCPLLEPLDKGRNKRDANTKQKSKCLYLQMIGFFTPETLKTPLENSDLIKIIYTNNKCAKKEIRKISCIYDCLKKYVGISLPKEAKCFYNENAEELRKPV